MMIRSKNKHNMKDKPFDLIAAITTDAKTGEMIFNHPMFIAVCGQKKQHISTPKAYLYYRKRYDIEPYFRFAKQKLLLEKYQTPNTKHFDNWLIIIQLATWLLYTASKHVNYQPREWEKYLKKTR